MKKTFIILFSIFIIACADGEIGGYTETIIRNANSVEPDTTTKEEPIALAKAEPIEEDFSVLDEDELREKLMNTFPKPKAAPTSEKIVNYLKYIPHLAPQNVLIKKIQWDKLNPIFAEPENGYEYGFDRDPTDKSPDVYISVKEEPISVFSDAKFVPNLPIPPTPAAYEEYRLLHDEYNNGTINRAKAVNDYGILLDSQKEKTLKKPGVYTLYGKRTRGKKSEWISTKKRITVIPYQPKKIKFILHEYNGEKKITNKEKESKNFITQASVTTYFNKVYKQAVLEPEITLKKTEDYLIKVDMEKNSKIDYVDNDKFIYEQIYKAALQLKEHNNYLDIDSEKWHYIYAINKTRKI